ncbi:MAG: hypothetical protein H6R06_1852, partial [Proteobacteria bacterium]|nr:hypothetical protein [Pseudomonadota bacterium]
MAHQPGESASGAVASGMAAARLRGAGVLALSVVAWAALAWLVIDMGHPLAQLTMPMSSRWSTAQALAVWTMWAVMMAAMMLPSALPMVLAFMKLGTDAA